MTNKEILQADMLDILFEHRNKLYGAYALRKSYTHRLGLALGVALSIGLLFALMSFIKKNNGNGGAFSDDRMVILTDVDLDKEEIKEPERPKELPKTAQADYQPIVVVPDKEAEEIIENDDLAKSQISNQTVEGKPDDGAANPVSETTGAGDSIVTEPVKNDKPVLPDRKAGFPGGTAAWLEFLRKFLQAPEDMEPGQRIEVQVRFSIDADGNISNPEIIKSGGKSFDKEVLRVLKKMPRWDPAIQNGNYVSTAYTQPVIFIGVEE